MVLVRDAATILISLFLLTMSTRPQDDRNQEATVYLVGLARSTVQ
jgi:hypothetical protein